MRVPFLTTTNAAAVRPMDTVAKASICQGVIPFPPSELVDSAGAGAAAVGSAAPLVATEVAAASALSLSLSEAELGVGVDEESALFLSGVDPVGGVPGRSSSFAGAAEVLLEEESAVVPPVASLLAAVELEAAADVAGFGGGVGALPLFLRLLLDDLRAACVAASRRSSRVLLASLS